jgi:predicted DsbA family dithiol-disulfide isomerase
VQVEIWSDVVCPWCYIGKRRFEEALSGFEHAQAVEVVWRSFELDPSAPPVREGDPAERLARKYGMSVERARAAQQQLTELAATEGLDYHLERAAGGNTLDAHRLIHLAAAAGRGDAMKERLLRAHLVEARPIGDRATLIELAAEVGLDPDEVESMLESDALVAEVRADERRAVELDVTGVPFFLVDGRVAMPGAQSADLLGRLLDRAWTTSAEGATLEPGVDGSACSDDACAT